MRTLTVYVAAQGVEKASQLLGVVMSRKVSGLGRRARELIECACVGINHTIRIEKPALAYLPSSSELLGARWIRGKIEKGSREPLATSVGRD
jgi:hypothetical protein